MNFPLFSSLIFLTSILSAINIRNLKDQHSFNLFNYDKPSFRYRHINHTLHIANTTSSKYRQYGPLLLNFGQLRTKKDTTVIQGLINSNDEIYLAINCRYNLINVTTQSLLWKDWQSPKKEFEYKIIHDICSI